MWCYIVSILTVLLNNENNKSLECFWEWTTLFGKYKWKSLYFYFWHFYQTCLVYGHKNLSCLKISILLYAIYRFHLNLILPFLFPHIVHIGTLCSALSNMNWKTLSLPLMVTFHINIPSYHIPYTLEWSDCEIKNVGHVHASAQTTAVQSGSVITL
jgi:hypothetical protein